MKNQTVTTGKYTYAKGRRKTAVAGARIFEGKGEILVNDKPFKEYFPLEMDRKMIFEPLKTVELDDKVYFTLRIVGGGVKGQAEALRLGITRALIMIDAECKPALKAEGFLTRDPREVERKKPGQPKARKRFQFSKR